MTRLRIITFICVTSVICGLIVVLSHAQEDTLFSDWRPNSETRGIRFVGNKACLDCHAYQAAQLNTPMAQALEVAPDCKIVTARRKMTFRNGQYTYEISRQGQSVVYSVSDGVNTITRPILYCFGQGHVGQTYLFSNNNIIYETRVSYFEKLGRLDITIGHQPEAPASLDNALGRAIGGDERRECFACHSSGAVSGFELKLDRLTPGVTCEQCHGPGERHLVAVKEKKSDGLQIFNPGVLGAHELTQSFCGTCHRSFEQTMLMPGQSNINNIRFQPYRLFNSRGHNTNDPRVSCLACHDPHVQLQKDTSFYDSKCLACHLKPKEPKTERRSAPACPVGTNKCATCHMPRIELSGMHAEFTDHWIRIVKPNQPVPR